MLHDIFGLISPTEAAESRAAAAEQELSLLRQVRLVPHGEILWKMMGMMGWYGFRMSHDFPAFGWWKWVLEMWLVMFGSGGNVAVAASASVCVLLLQCSWFTVTTVLAVFDFLFSSDLTGPFGDLDQNAKHLLILSRIWHMCFLKLDETRLYAVMKPSVPKNHKKQDVTRRVWRSGCRIIDMNMHAPQIQVYRWMHVHCNYSKLSNMPVMSKIENLEIKRRES